MRSTNSRSPLAKKLLSGFLTMVIVVSSFSVTGFFSKNVSAIGRYNIGENDYYHPWANKRLSYMIETSDGGYMIFATDYFDKEYTVQYYDKNFKLTKEKTIKRELEDFGAFYADNNGYFVISGQYNAKESDTFECIRVTKYNKSWKRIGSCSMKACNVRDPFHSGCTSVVSSGKYLIVRTGRTMYTSADGLIHQSNLTFMVDTSTMTIADPNEYDYGYCSHSFNQFVKVDNDHLIAADHGDGYPRGYGIYVYNANISSGSFSAEGCESYVPFTFWGKKGANVTYATLGGLEVSDTSYIIAGSSSDQSNGDYTPPDIIICTVNKKSGKMSTKWLTKDRKKDSEGINEVGTPFLVKVDQDKFVVMWDRHYEKNIYYAIIDGNGNKIGDIKKVKGQLSDCHPFVSKGKIVWYTYDGYRTDFYKLDPSTGKIINKHYGWVKKSGKWYYVEVAGKKTTGVKKIDGKYYLFSSKGVMQKSGWKKKGSNWYYLRKDGSAYANKWLKSSGKWYYFGSNAKMVKGKSMKIGKKTYKFKSNGVCKNH